MQKIYFIVNPVSGKGNNNIPLDVVNSIFKKDEFEVIISYSKYPKHTIELTKKAIENKPNSIIACGGDGTINEIASMLVNTSIKLGIIPLGNENRLAANLNIPIEINKALERIKIGNTTSIDVGKFNEYFFFINAGLGIDAEIIKKQYESGKRTLVSCIKTAIKASVLYKPKTLQYTLEKVNHKIKPLLLFVSNSNEMAYNMSLTPEASLSDGYLNLIIIPKINLFKKCIFGIQILSKKTHKNKNVIRRLIKEVNIYFDKKQNCLIQIGEHLSINVERIHIKTLEKSLTIIN